MKQLRKISRGSVLMLCAFGLSGCGYSSSPGIVLETKQYPLSDKATLIVTRNLDRLKAGNPFRYEWYVVKCKSGTGTETVLMEDMVRPGLFSNEIPKERIQITGGGIGYAYFGEIVVFDNHCNRLSYFHPLSTTLIDPNSAVDVLIESAHMDQSGLGHANLAWGLKEGGGRTLVLRTSDFGVHWALPNTGGGARDDVRVEVPSALSDSVFREITDKLEKSEYVVMSGSVVRRPQPPASTSTSLNYDGELKILQKAVDVAKAKLVIRNGGGVIIIDRKEYYEIVIGNPDELREMGSSYAYVARVLVNKNAQILVEWLSD